MGKSVHTELTVRNFASFASIMLLIELCIVGMGAVDLVMIAPLGMAHTAALGLGDLISAAVFAFFIGLVDAYSGRLSIAEGKGALARRLPVLALSSFVILLGFQAFGIFLAWVAEPALVAVGQDAQIVPAIGAYLDARFTGIIPAVVASALGTGCPIHWDHSRCCRFGIGDNSACVRCSKAVDIGSDTGIRSQLCVRLSVLVHEPCRVVRNPRKRRRHRDGSRSPDHGSGGCVVPVADSWKAGRPAFSSEAGSDRR